MQNNQQQAMLPVVMVPVMVPVVFIPVPVMPWAGFSQTYWPNTAPVPGAAGMTLNFSGTGTGSGTDGNNTGNPKSDTLGFPQTDPNQPSLDDGSGTGTGSGTEGGETGNPKSGTLGFPKNQPQGSNPNAQKRH